MVHDSSTTLISTSLMGLFRGLSGMHGASGICWGYQLLAFFFLTVYAQKYGLRALMKEAWFWIFAVLTAFDFIGINVMEVFVMKWRFFDNFGQTMHLVSILVLVPFVVIYRSDIERLTLAFFAGEVPQPVKGKKALVVFGLVCILNLVATVFVAAQAIKKPDTAFTVTPASGKSIESLGSFAEIVFTDEMETGSEQNISYTVYSGREGFSWKTEWSDANTMRVVFSRKPETGDKIKLSYVVKGKLGQLVTVKLDYR